MAKKNLHIDLQNLPDCVADFIKLVIKKMRYRKRVRQDVQAELAAHFEDELKDCATNDEKEKKAQKLITEFGDAKLLAVLLRRAKKRCRPVWKKVLVRSLQAFGVIFLYILICTSPMIIGRPTIKVNYIDWLNEFVRAGRNESDNARPYYNKAVELSVKMPDWLANSFTKWPTDFNDVQLQSLVSFLEENRQAFEVLRTATEHPYYWSSYQKSSKAELMEALMPYVMETLPKYRYLAHAMLWQIRYEAYSGDVSNALRDCVVLTKFGDHFNGQGLLIEQLVGVAIEAMALNEISRILEKTNVSADTLKAVQEGLTKQFDKREQIISLQAEKVFLYDQIQRGFTDNGKGDGRVLARGLPYAIHDNKDLLSRLLTLRYPSRLEVVAKIDKYFQQADQLFEETPWYLHNKDVDEDEWNQTLNQTILMLRLSGPAHERVSQLAWRLETNRIGLLTLLAIMRYQKDQSHYPENLTELVSTGYLNHIPTDPFGGRLLVYRKTEDGFVLYSIGLDFEDNGGTLGHDSQGQPRMWADNGDWVFWPVPKSLKSQ